MSDSAVISPVSVARPEAGEYDPYYERYISLVTGTDILGTLESQRRQMLLLLSGCDEADADFRYAPDKWSVKEVLGHVCDTERIFAYRALRFARADRTPLPGYEQDDYARIANFDARNISDLAADFASVRAATIALLRSFDAEAWQRRGSANDNEVSVRALAHIIAGHELHHVAILRERYLK